MRSAGGRIAKNCRTLGTTWTSRGKTVEREAETDTWAGENGDVSEHHIPQRKLSQIWHTFCRTHCSPPHSYQVCGLELLWRKLIAVGPSELFTDALRKIQRVDLLPHSSNCLVPYLKIWRHTDFNFFKKPLNPTFASLAFYLGSGSYIRLFRLCTTVYNI